MIKVTPGWKYQHPIRLWEGLIQLFDKYSHSHVDISAQIEAFSRIHIVKNILDPLFSASWWFVFTCWCYQREEKKKEQSPFEWHDTRVNQVSSENEVIGCTSVHTDYQPDFICKNTPQLGCTSVHTDSTRFYPLSHVKTYQVLKYCCRVAQQGRRLASPV